MAEPNADRDAERPVDDPELLGPPATPRWVKVSGVVAVIVIALVAVMLATGGPGEHGPGRHSGGDGDRPPAGIPKDHVPPSDLPEGHEPPPGHAPAQ